MQRITIKDFGPLQEAEIVVDKALLLIGEQASGKSTTAKLIYFFRSLSNTLWHVAIEENQSERVIELFEEQVTRKFIENFGTSLLTSDSAITYDYSVDDAKSIQLSMHKEQIRARVSDQFRFQLSSQEFRKLSTAIKKYSQVSKPQDEHYQEQARQDLDEFITDLLGNRQILFYPAGRSVAVNYSDSIKLTFFGNLASDLRVANLPPERTGGRRIEHQTLEFVLMTEFIRRTEEFKDRFRNHDFSTLIKEQIALGEPINLETLEEAKEKISKILRGEYRQDASGEKIYFSDTKYVFLSDASSGQQEVVRLVQDIFLLLLNQESAFRIIEEPEAHLWPMAQKHLLELFALLLNQTQSQIVITTHSPYILSVLNNLLYATRVANLNGYAKEVGNVINPKYWLDPQSLNIYFLSQGRCQSVMDKRLGLIDQNLLDEVSEVLGDEFDMLYTIRAKTYR